MDLLDLVIIALFSALFFSEHTKLASKVFVLCIVLFLFADYILPDSYSYAVSGTVNLIIFITLVNSKSKTYFLVSILSVCLIFVNIQGYIDYERYLLPDNYDHAYLILLTVQLILLYARAVIYGIIDRLNLERDLVQLVIDSGFEAFDSYLYKKEVKK